MKKVRIKKSRILIIIILIAVIVIGLELKNRKTKETGATIEKAEEENLVKEDPIKKVKITAVGDCTIGWDPRYGYETRYDRYLNDNDGDYGYYFEKVKNVFENDDLTIVNLEGCFTNSKNIVPKEFNLFAPPEFKQVLVEGNVEIASFANNHSYDFGEEGYNDTLEALDSVNIPYYGFDKYLIKEVNGIKIGFFGFLDIDCENYEDIDNAIKYLKDENCDLIICSMHWGVEGSYAQNDKQTKMGHYLIDNGVDLVLGSHPHRIQGIEKYNGKYIVYSLSNFTFGANQNPNDKDTFIFEQEFTFENGELKLDDNINIIPASQSGVTYTNNYQPIILEGNEQERVLNKILKYSKGFEYELSDINI